jgi:ubiquinone/menaquinone biosynthesis C-methylase UbiE
MLSRTLEPEIMDTMEDAMEYDAMDHTTVNEVFVTDLLGAGPLGRDVLDIGTGTALIPVELCRRNTEVRVMASDAAASMLDIARYNLELHRATHRIQLHFGDAKKLVFQDDYFDTVISNSIVHHLPDPGPLFAEALRVVRPGGLVFFRDLYRPESDQEVEQLVATYAANDTDYCKQLLRQSLHAALTLTEVAQMIAAAGSDPSAVTMTSDRHWTWVARKPTRSVSEDH